MNWQNLLRKIVLLSPFHSQLSDEFCLLTITAKNSNQQQTIPIRYIQKENTVLLITQETWWQHLIDGAIVRLQLHGQEMLGVGFPILSDKQPAIAGLTYFLRQHPEEAKRLGITMDEDGIANVADIAAAVKATTLIQIIVTQGYEPILETAMA